MKTNNNNKKLDDLRLDQIYFKDDSYVNNKAVIPSSFPGTKFLTTGSDIVAKNNIIGLNAVSDNNLNNRGFQYIKLGSVGFNDSGADWVFQSAAEGVVEGYVPNQAALEIELKLNLIDSKIRNAMYTDLPILKWAPRYQTVISGKVKTIGDLFGRFLLAAQRNTFIIGKFLTDIGKIIDTTMHFGKKNKLLVERSNILINKINRNKFRMAFSTLMRMIPNIMTDKRIMERMKEYNRVFTIVKGVNAPLNELSVHEFRKVFDPTHSATEIINTDDNNVIELTINTNTNVDIQTLVTNLLTLDSQAWETYAESLVTSIIDDCNDIILELARVQRGYQILQTAITAIGTYFNDSYGFYSYDFSVGAVHNTADVLSFMMLNFGNVNYEPTGNALEKVVTAEVLSVYDQNPANPYKTNFFLACKAMEGAYTELVDISQLWPTSGLFLSNNIAITGANTAKKCALWDSYLCNATLSKNDITLFGVDGASISLTISKTSAQVSCTKALVTAAPLTNYLKMIYPFVTTNLKPQIDGTSFTTWPSYADWVNGSVTVIYQPILRNVLDNAQSSFGLV